MNYKEALTEIKFQLEDVGYYDVVYWDSIPTAILKVCVEALEKQIPKKINNDDGFGGRCPVCGYYIVKSIFSSKGHKYCSECGQAIDWEVKCRNRQTNQAVGFREAMCRGRG